MSFLIPLLIYAATIALLAMLNKREFRRCPEKGRRYAALPLPYKLMCWAGVVPLFVSAAFVHWALSFVALAFFAVLENMCVGWYKKNGLLPHG